MVNLIGQNNRFRIIGFALLLGSAFGFPALAESPLENLKDPNYWSQLCTLLSTDKPTEALTACERSLALHPGDAKRWAYYGALQLRLKQYPEAIASLNQSLKRQAKNSQALTDQCIAWTKIGNKDAAVSACDQALKINANWGERSAVVAHHYRSVALDQAEAYQAAIGFYEQMLAQEPNNSLVLLYRCLAFGKLAEHPKAIESCTPALSGDGNWGIETPAIAWSTQGLAYRHTGQLESAVQSFDRALLLSPNEAETWRNLGDTLRQLKRSTEALTAYNRLVELQPNSSQALLAQCTVMNQLQQAETALVACQKAIQVNQDWGASNIAQAWNQQSLALAMSDKLEEALAAANRAVGMRPDWGEAWSDRAVVLWYLNRYEEALASVQQALKLDASNPRAWANQGRILRSLNQPENAIAAYTEALKLDPQNAAIWANQSAVQWSIGDHSAALESADSAIKVDPNLAQAWQNRAVALVALKNYTEAQTSYEQAISLDKTNAASWTGLGLVLVQLQDYPEAIQALQTALSLNPQQPIAQQALKVLTEWQNQSQTNPQS